VTDPVTGAAITRRPLEVDVSTAVQCAGARLGGWVCAPATPDPARPPVVLACLAGGTCSTGYWDLEVEGRADYSMAAYLASRGFVVVAFDHLGIGASSPVDDIYRVTPTIAAVAQAAALDAALRALRADLGDCTAVGVGHSMGGMILTVLQHDYGLFDAIAVLGHGGDGLPDVLTAEEAALHVDRPYPEVEADIVALARTRFGPDATVPSKRPVPRTRPVPGSFLLPDVPDDVRAAFVAQQVPQVFSCGLTSMIPGSTDAHKAAIDVPVFLAFGDHDLTGNYVGNLARYESTDDRTVFVLRGSAHCHNQATTRLQLWDRLAVWARGVDEGVSAQRLGDRGRSPGFS
jgi:pimeloyl-ACP methyl ester carboxylesterase